MCGLAGIIQFDHQPVEERLITQMTRRMAHRGPDATGTFSEPGIALGHLRLSIIDLSAAANQPFSDNAGRYRIIFNGEMYNYEAVKKMIPDYEFRTNSDTEVILAAYIKWGAECINHFRGMFCFAIWDRQEKEIFICRDRLGVKPMYYYVDNQRFIFASETRAILSSGLVNHKLNQKALKDYFRYQSISSPDSIISGIKQLPAGSWMKIKEGKLSVEQYWEVSHTPVPNFDFRNESKVKGRLHDLLLEAVARRMVSDVPVAAFLSGGIDSSVIVGLMAEAGKGKPNSFTISFEEKEFDESQYAELVAKKFNTNHTRINLEPSILLDELDAALNAMDSPSGDGINTYIVSKAIRQNGLKVALSGVGGDELFAGYPIFRNYLQIRKQSWLWNFPLQLRKMAGIAAPEARKQKFAEILAQDSCTIEKLYPVFRQIVSSRKIGELTRLYADGHCETVLEEILTTKKDELSALPLLSQVSAAEYLGYTQNTLLKDGDQMSMASSLELREPFFDHDLLEFVLAIPDEIKNPVYPKSLLVESVKPLIPDDIVFRKKQGFLFPWEIWLRHELREFCHQHIQKISERNFVEGEALQKYWQSFLAGDRTIRWQEIWLFVVLEYWLEKNHVN
jgi:asparagine synthase (glutamine-hydrolysing)